MKPATTKTTINVRDSIKAIKSLVRAGWVSQYTYTYGWSVAQVFARGGRTLIVVKTY